MLNLGKFPTQSQYSTLLHSPISHNLQFPSKPHLSFATRPNSHAVLGKLQSGLGCNALKTKKIGDFGLAEMDGPDEFEDQFLDGEPEGDEDEVVIPLENMKKWLEKKPRGFGEGKVYDTSIEDKLMEEIEQSRKAQLANVNKLKHSPPAKRKKETSKQDTGSTHIQDGFRVRLVNLPKKKNIQRDLKLAFKEVPGILNIVPVVSGNKKTRDPVCKGLAFVHFKSLDDAQRFVQDFSGKSISFGKVQKQIICEMSDSKLPTPPCDQSVGEGNHTPQKAIHNLDEDSDTGIETNDSLLDSWDENAPGELDDADETHISEQEEDDIEIIKTSTTSNSNLSKELEVVKESGMDPSSSKQEKKLKTKEKKVSSKSKKDKIPKLNIPGSLKRLKIREKEVLTGVFSKYGANATLTVKEQSR
ncbi:hypothetical protein CDL12_14223 [Handroanthus impetiginosus]|uniref:RRM domain-containing protein n=1 Tax=Handroanthus impetiginosus TaxID=429701 RepID=A0A2G9H6L1_9LAMI|nr:hypothetical protein CDL12_14223 [Handroanthus impetiginosus]